MANTYWTNTGIELRRGERVSVCAFGRWTIDRAGPHHGPEGQSVKLGSCAFGSLVASIGLSYKGPTHCIGRAGQLVAERDGILFIGQNDGILEDNLGSVVATIEGGGRPSVSTSCGSARMLHPARLAQSSWAELGGRYVSLVLPTAQVIARQAQADAAIAALDTWYDSHRSLAGAVPYGGQPIRFVPDPRIGEVDAWMLSGNPVRVDPKASAEFLQVHERRKTEFGPAWGIAHEMGHNFSVINGGRFLIGPGPGEAWANVFTLYSLRRYGHPEGAKSMSQICEQARAYLSQAKPYSVFRSDPDVPLCMLMELRQQYGWSMFQRFFHAYNRSDQNLAPPSSAPDATRWTWVRDVLSRAAGADITPLLRKYRVPLNG